MTETSIFMIRYIQEAEKLADERFKKALEIATAALGAFLILTWVWPKPKDNPNELIPPQYAKIVLSKAFSKPASAESSSLPGAKSKSAAAVTEAFRAKALKSAVNGLLKGGMTQLLAESDFVTGNRASTEARRIFDSKSNALQPSSQDIGSFNNKSAKVALLGGGGKGAYGKGVRAGVSGQGHAFVGMDLGNSTVEEGLTKDEVGEVIHSHMSEIRYCYESAMIRNPSVEGKLVMDFTIVGNGLVKSAEAKNSTLSDPRMDDCILRRLLTWKFPQPKGGVDVAVSYPFIFKALGR